MIENRYNKIKNDKISDKSAILYKGELFTYYKSGLTRHVFINSDKTKVIKTVISNLFDYNKEEYEIYNSASDDNKERMAKTSLSNEGFIEQEFCTPINESNNKMSLKQILFAESCRNEVGWIGDRLVCFDLDEYKKY